MTAFKTVFIVASIALAGPALADGTPLITYFPNLEFPTQHTATTRDLSIALSPSSDACSQLEQDVGVDTDACGTLSAAELVKRKLIGDE